MPKIVDHQQRRRELLDAVVRVIVRDGITGATTRAIAEESGWSTGSLSHYFTDHSEILTSALQYSHQRIHQRWEEKLHGLRGLDALRELILDNLPLDEERISETRLEMVFWSQALTNPEMLSVQRNEDRNLYEATRRAITEAFDDGEAVSDLPVEDVTERVLALIDGLSLHALLHGPRLSIEMMERLVEHELEALTASVVSAEP